MLEDSNFMVNQTGSVSYISAEEPKTRSTAKLTEKTRRRADEFKTAKNESPKNQQKQKNQELTVISYKSFPNLPGTLGAIPNLFLRSALFGISSNEKLFLREKILAPAGYEIYISGNQLTVNDLQYLDVLFSLSNENERCSFTYYQFLKLMGKTDCRNNYRLLKIFFSKVISNAIEIVDKNKTNLGYEGSIISDKVTNESTGQVVVFLNPRLRKLFQPTAFTFMFRPVAEELRGQPLAYWIFAFYSTHASPFPYRVETIYALCRSDSKSVASFTQCLKKSLDKIKIAHEKFNKKFDWIIEDGLLKVNKSASRSQNKHLMKKRMVGVQR